MLAPTDELVGIVGSEGLEPVVDPTVDAFEDLLKRLDGEERPLTLVFALGPQREAAHAAPGRGARDGERLGSWSGNSGERNDA